MSADPAGSPGTRRWNDPGWYEQASAWIGSTLADRGLTQTGPIERVRTRFWSVHLSVATEAGRFWFKENCPLQSFEARLLDRLQPIAGDRLIELTAIEPDQGWLLTPDQGPTARDAGGGPDIETYERLLTQWGSVQRAVMSSGLDLAGCGVTTLAPADAVDYLLTHVERLNGLPSDDLGRMDDEVAARLRALVPKVRQWAETVAATGLSLTLDHSDLHLGNAFAGPSGRLRIFDLSDSVRSFPLGTLMVPLRMLTRGDGGVQPDSHSVARVTDAYLETMTDLVPLAELRAAVPAALELAKLNRHESWRRALDGADAASYAELGDAPAGWLDLLDRDVLG